LFLLFWLLWPGAAAAQTAPDAITVIVTVAGETYQPIQAQTAHLRLIVITNQLNAAELVTITEMDAGICVTDSAGKCQITVTNPPRDGGGFVRGRVTLDGSPGGRAIFMPAGVTELDAGMFLTPEGVGWDGHAAYEDQDMQPTDIPRFGEPTPAPSFAAPPRTLATRSPWFWLVVGMTACGLVVIMELARARRYGA
jgi:hypothetical protein